MIGRQKDSKRPEMRSEIGELQKGAFVSGRLLSATRSRLSPRTSSRSTGGVCIKVK